MTESKIVDLHKVIYPEEYKTSYVLTYPSLNDELKELIGKTGYVKDFKTKYHKALRFIENLKKTCVMNKKLFEELLDADGLYSMRLIGEVNIRIIFDFVKLEGKEVVVLFSCFQEKRTSDYKDGITTAKMRRKELFDI